MHDTTDQADALNDYLDAIVDASLQHHLPSGAPPDLQASVDRFFDLAHRGGITPFSTRRPSMTAHIAQPSLGNQVLGGNDARPHQERRRFNPRHLNTWATGFLTALVIVGIAAGAWLLGNDRFPPSERHRLAAIATDEGTPAAIWPDPISPDENPWIANIAPEECAAEPLSFEDYASLSATDPGAPNASYEIVGVPTTSDAEAVVAVLRSWEACRALNDRDRMRAYVTPEYIFFYSGSTVENAPYQEMLADRRTQASLSFTLWAAETGFYSLAIIEGVEPPPAALESFEFAQGVLDGTYVYNSFQAPSPLYSEWRYNPNDAALLADGRIMVPATYVYWAEDPWLQAHGISPDATLVSSATILKLVDGEWKIDESGITVCIGACGFYLNNNAPGATPQATPAP